MGTKQTTIFVVVLALFIGYGWYELLVIPARPSDIYPPWSRLMCLVPATVAWVISAGNLFYRLIRARKV
jgi:hypothetical protein